MFLKRDAKSDLRQSIYRLWTAAGHGSVYQYNYKVSTYIFHRVFNYRNQKPFSNPSYMILFPLFNASVTKKNTAKIVIFYCNHPWTAFSPCGTRLPVNIDTYSLIILSLGWMKNFNEGEELQSYMCNVLRILLWRMLSVQQFLIYKFVFLPHLKIQKFKANWWSSDATLNQNSLKNYFIGYAIVWTRYLPAGRRLRFLHQLTVRLVRLYFQSLSFFLFLFSSLQKSFVANFETN